MISLSEYRKNISIFTKRANEHNISFIITSHGKPVGEYRPLKYGDIQVTTRYSQDFVDELAKMERDSKAGDFHGPFTKEESREYLNSLM